MLPVNNCASRATSSCAVFHLSCMHVSEEAHDGQSVASNCSEKEYLICVYHLERWLVVSSPSPPSLLSLPVVQPCGQGQHQDQTCQGQVWHTAPHLAKGCGPAAKCSSHKQQRRGRTLPQRGRCLSRLATRSLRLHPHGAGHALGCPWSTCSVGCLLLGQQGGPRRARLLRGGLVVLPRQQPGECGGLT